MLPSRVKESRQWGVFHGATEMFNLNEMLVVRTGLKKKSGSIYDAFVFFSGETGLQMFSE